MRPGAGMSSTSTRQRSWWLSKICQDEHMEVTFATEAAPGRRNEDLVIVGDSFVIVLDGVTQLPHVDTGCSHDPVWLVRTLGGLLAETIDARPCDSLAGILGRAIRRLREEHVSLCDLTNPDSPSSTAAIVRERDEFLDYLVLCDSTVVLEQDNGYTAVTDDRTARLPAYDRVSVARLRNAPGGFWVASTQPEAASHALTGSVRRESLRRVMVCTDGVSRLVERFGRTWTDVLALIDHGGPGEVIDAVRSAERAAPASPGRPAKVHDDATVAICYFDGARPSH
jgi:hypothetical protein